MDGWMDGGMDDESSSGLTKGADCGGGKGVECAVGLPKGHLETSAIRIFLPFLISILLSI